MTDYLDEDAERYTLGLEIVLEIDCIHRRVRLLTPMLSLISICLFPFGWI